MNTVVIVRPYVPNTPRNIAVWAIVQRFIACGEAEILRAIVESGVYDTRRWAADTPEQQARDHMKWLARSGVIDIRAAA